MRKGISIYLTFAAKLILIFMMSLIISTFIVGFTGYKIAQNELNKKGEQVLENSVILAIDFIRSEYDKVQSGTVVMEKSQEYIKATLMGPMDDETGFRKLHHRIDLGDHGYFIIYDSTGSEVMHPNLEGQNVFNVKDLYDDNRYLVQEQIDTGKSGGFVYYSWLFPNSKKVGRKISYCNYFPEWDWIVVATAYELDFNRSANVILLILLGIITVLIIIASIIIVRYVRMASKPIVDVAMGMKAITENRYVNVENVNYNDEITLLIEGYNNMTNSLKSARMKIEKNDEFIKHIAFHDELTSLPNRHGIESYLIKEFKSGCESGFLVQLDILGLKIINSTLGFIQGDFILKLIGYFLLGLKSDDIYIARTNSNEFTIWLINITYEEVSPFLYKLRESVKEHIQREGFGNIVDIQLAMSFFPDHGKSFSELYDKVTMAMKSVKDSKSLNLIEYNEEINEALQIEISMRKYLSKALKKNEIIPYYQTQVDNISGKISGVEALSRWHSEELGIVSPVVFIPQIESQNMVIEFTNYMVDKVLNDYEDLKNKYNNDITISINISPSYFLDPTCLEYIQDLFNKYSIPTDKLILEITEDVFISDTDKINSIIDKLHDMGILISIDDFGTGYSSLNYLTKMNFDEMKIDKSFIDKILEDPKAFQLFEILCDIAKIYDYKIVTEGVELEEQLEMIKRTSQCIIQGYIYSKPEPIIPI